MMFRKNIRSASAIAIIGILGIAGHLGARENVVTAHHKNSLKTTAAGCLPATYAIDLDINNVRARLMTGGDMWWNIGLGSAAYEIPKVVKANDPSRHSQFAASCWIGGFDQQGQLKVAAQTYRQDGNDYWPGALDPSGKISSDTCNLWDRMWKVDKSTITKFISLFKTLQNINDPAFADASFDVIKQWPGAGNRKAVGSDGKTNLSLNANNTYAAFKDLNGNGVYEPSKGEYPVLESNGVQSNPDQLIWWVFNDAGNVKQQSLTAAMGVEVQTSAFAFASQDFLNNSTFYNYRVINRGPYTIDSAYIAVWDDCDLGYYLDDFIGCDTSRGLGIQYNGTNDDGGAANHPVNSYGSNPPQVGLDFFQGPKRPIHRTGLPDTLQQLGMTNFTYYNNDASIIGNPVNGIQIYFYMTGSITNGQRFTDDFQGPGIPSKGYGAGPVSNFVFWGDPGNRTEWSECACNNNPSDRRFIFSSGPFQLLPGAINDITFGCIWAPGVGGCPSTNFKTIRSIDDQAQALFDNHFKTVVGPQAPRMVMRELDKKLVFYLVNDYGSNNYGENYGNDKGPYKDSLYYHQVSTKALKISKDTLYRFEGYQVYQLANSQVKVNDIFDPVTGEVDGTKAALVAEGSSDIKNGVTQIVNYIKEININDSTYLPQIKVSGTADLGIKHSFEVTSDKFATGSDKSLVNYHNYYYVAIAYAYNNFANFDSHNAELTQDVAYLSSSSAGDGTPIAVVSAMPDPTNGSIGAVVNAEYGDGVAITRLEGIGNGGNTLQLDSLSEATAVRDGSVAKASYVAGSGPVTVKVVDPVRIPAYDWVLQIMGSSTTDTGITTAGSWKLTALDGNNVKATIYSELTIGAENEQILEKYGLSVSIKQVFKPGTDQFNGNGYITSDVTFADASIQWLYGVKDEADSSFANWLRAGNNQNFKGTSNTNPCDFNDYSKRDTNLFYQNLFASSFTPMQSSWGPYALGAAYFNKHFGTGTQCGFQVAYTATTQNLASMNSLSDVDIVFTSDKTLWTRCAVVEEQEDPLLAQGGAPKFKTRSHRGWTGQANGNSPIYSDNPDDTGMSWFPGYAIDQNTGIRLNIVFGEDSYLGSDNGNDMVWNPSSNEFGSYDNSIIFGGKHVVYVMSTKYDSDKAFVGLVRQAQPSNTFLRAAYTNAEWVGLPLTNPLTHFKSLQDGYIPTTTRVRFRVTRPYEPYQAVDPATISSTVPVDTAHKTNSYYTFSTKGLAVDSMSNKTDRGDLLSKINIVPNPYYGYSGYEQNRYDTKVKITNLPPQVTVHIYSLDGSLIRTLTKNDPNISYIDWDIKNTAGLPVASGMYMIDIQAAGIGEKVLRWFGATRPIDVTTY
jgi:hypothetical protein